MHNIFSKRERLLKSRSTQYSSQIRSIIHTCLYLEGEIILFLILIIWEHDASLILWIIEFILILHLFDFLLNGANLLQFRKLKMFTIELQYPIQFSLNGTNLWLEVIHVKLGIIEEVII